MSPPHLYFDEFRADTRALELTRDGERVELAPAPVRLLLILARRSGELVTRRELHEELWPEGGVDAERLINTYVLQIRRALGERAGDDRFIRTYPGRGYRFLPEVTVREDAGGGLEPTGVDGGRGGVPVLPTALAILVLALLGSVVLDLRSSGERRQVADALPEPLRVEYLMGIERLDHPLPGVRAAAEEHFRRVTEARPGFASAHSGLARSLLWKRDLEGAGSAAKVAIRLDPDDAYAHLVLGSALLSYHWDWTGAERHLREAVRLDPESAEARVGLAFLLVSSGRTADAGRELDRAHALEPVSPVVTGDLGILYHWIGRHERALELCTRTVELEPRAPWGYGCAGRAAAALGLDDRARRLRNALDAREETPEPSRISVVRGGGCRREIERPRSPLWNAPLRRESRAS